MSSYFKKSGENAFSVYRTDSPEYLIEFLNYKSEIENRSIRTIFNYYISLKIFLKWINYRKNPDDVFDDIDIRDVKFEDVAHISMQDIIEFLSFCNYERDNNSDSRATKLSAIKSFYKYLTSISGHLSTADPSVNIPSPKKAQTVPKYLSDTETYALLNYGITEGKTSKNGTVRENKTKCRDYCILTWFLNCGMRLAELEGINLKDIREDNGHTTLLIRGKGNKERLLVLNKACLDAYDDYLVERASYGNKVDNKALFISPRTGKRLVDRSIEYIVEKSLKEAGLEGRGYSPHKLRHTIATKLYQSGIADTMTIGRVLGHASPNSTQIYVHSSVDQIADAMEHTVLAKEKINGAAATAPLIKNV